MRKEVRLSFEVENSDSNGESWGILSVIAREDGSISLQEQDMTSMELGIDEQQLLSRFLEWSMRRHYGKKA